MPAPTINGGENSRWKWPNFRLSGARDLDLNLGSGHIAYHHASHVDLYIHTKFYSNGRNFLWTDGQTYGRTDGRTDILRLTLLGRLGGVGPYKCHNRRCIVISAIVLDALCLRELLKAWSLTAMGVTQCRYHSVDNHYWSPMNRMRRSPAQLYETRPPWLCKLTDANISRVIKPPVSKNSSFLTLAFKSVYVILTQIYDARKMQTSELPKSAEFRVLLKSELPIDRVQKYVKKPDINTGNRRFCGSHLIAASVSSDFCHFLIWTFVFTYAWSLTSCKTRKTRLQFSLHFVGFR